MIRALCSVMAIIIWATLCIKLIADPIMTRIMASSLDLNHAFIAVWYVSALVILVVLVGAYVIMRFAGSKRWVP